jgi:hypothetical protein
LKSDDVMTGERTTMNASLPSANVLECDGCGQAGSAEHVARRLKRLEWATRYRPVHIQTLFLGAASPDANAEFLYSPGDEFQGGAAALLEVAGIVAAGKSADAVLVEFQRRGYFLTHVLECPLDRDVTGEKGIAHLPGEKSPRSEDRRYNISLEGSFSWLLEQRSVAVAARIRRSLKPKRVVLLGAGMETLAAQWSNGELGCPLLLDDGKPFRLEGAGVHHNFALLRAALEIPLSAV